MLILTFCIIIPNNLKNKLASSYLQNFISLKQTLVLKFQLNSNIMPSQDHSNGPFVLPCSLSVLPGFHAFLHVTGIIYLTSILDLSIRPFKPFLRERCSRYNFDSGAIRFCASCVFWCDDGTLDRPANWFHT